MITYSDIVTPYKPEQDNPYNKTCVTTKDSYQPIRPTSMASILIQAVKGTCD